MTEQTIDPSIAAIPQVEAQSTDSNVAWNFAANLIDMIFFTLGMSLISRETVMPLLVSSLTDSKLAIGLAPAIFSLGFYLPQLLIANFSERLRYKKPFVMLLGGFGERGAYFLIVPLIWWMAASSPGVTLVLFLTLLAISATSSGTATPAWYDMIAKVIPVNRRGIFSGVGHSVGALLGIGGAFVVGWILAEVAYPNNFALCFLLAAGSFAISFVGLAINREPPSPAVKASISFWQYLRQLPNVLRSNANYTRFLLSRTTMQLGMMATGFFIVYGKEQFQLSGSDVGLLTATLVATQAVMNPVWGMIGDRRGYKIVLVGVAFAASFAALSAWMAQSFYGLLLTFVLMGTASAGDAVSTFNIILEFCAPADRPTYIGLTNSLLAPVLTLAPLLGGWLATMLGYPPMFLIAMTIACLGGLLMALWVQEPRGHEGVRG